MSAAESHPGLVDDVLLGRTGLNIDDMGKELESIYLSTKGYELWRLGQEALTIRGILYSKGKTRSHPVANSVVDEVLRRRDSLYAIYLAPTFAGDEAPVPGQGAREEVEA